MPSLVDDSLDNDVNAGHLNHSGHLDGGLDDHTGHLDTAADGQHMLNA